MSRVALGLAVVATSILSGCQADRGESNADAADSNLVVVEQYFEDFDTALSLEAVDRWVTPDFRSHDAGATEPVELAEWRESLVPFFSGFSEIRHVVRESVSEGDRIALLVDITLLHTGEFAGFEPTGRTIEVSEMLIFRIEDGKLAEEWILFDSASFLEQLQG